MKFSQIEKDMELSNKIRIKDLVSFLLLALLNEFLS